MDPASEPGPRGSRRAFLRTVLAASVGVAVDAGGASQAAAAGSDGRYGPLDDRDGSGLLLPKGFTARVIARSGQPIGPRGLIWRGAPDGAATFDDGLGGWYHAVNHEVREPGGGVSVVRYDASGRILDAYSVLEGSSRNCAGGPTPWGTWLSCEEVERGVVYECRVTEPGQGTVVPALGRFRHEAVAVDPIRQRLYLTEDEPDGLFYRFTPTSYPDLADGRLEVAVVTGDALTWAAVPDPQAADTDVRAQLDGLATSFAGGEGIWYHGDRIWFTTKGDGRVWELDVTVDRLTVAYEPSGPDPVLTGVDNLTVELGSGDVLVAEDSGNMEVVAIAADGSLSPILRIPGHEGSEVTGPAFNPAGDRLYISSQRGSDGDGVTFEVHGPFRGTGAEPDAGVSLPAEFVGIGVVAAAGATAFLLGRRRQSSRRQEEQDRRDGPLDDPQDGARDALRAGDVPAG